MIRLQTRAFSIRLLDPLAEMGTAYRAGRNFVSGIRL
jgi:hypothetical protein